MYEGYLHVNVAAVKYNGSMGKIAQLSLRSTMFIEFSSECYVGNSMSSSSESAVSKFFSVVAEGPRLLHDDFLYDAAEESKLLMIGVH